jgi:hypothetical protein
MRGRWRLVMRRGRWRLVMGRGRGRGRLVVMVGRRGRGAVVVMGRGWRVVAMMRRRSLLWRRTVSRCRSWRESCHGKQQH